jgi:hypothetical protein
MWWWLLQLAIILGVVGLVNDRALNGGAVVWGLAFAFLATWILSGLFDWLARRRARPSERREPRGDNLRLSGTWRHPGNRAKLTDRRRIGQDVRKLI